MKELSIEQKAKRYDEAKYIMKEYLESGNAGVIAENTIKKAFPELKESEDERIRKELLQIAKESEDSFYMVMTPDKRKHLIAWLEKQGNANKEYWRGYREGKQEILDKYAELEKQGEQKPDTNCLLSWSETDEKMFQSLEGIVKDYWAKAEQEKNEIKIREASNVSYFLKTIQKSPLCWIKCSDGLPNKDGIYLVVTDGRHNDVYDMARYDSIEGWHKASEIIYWMPIPQLNNKSIIEQKLADNIEKPWSEEDNEHLERILKELENQRQIPLNRPYLEEIESDYNWLKSLKDRVQPKQELSKEDEVTRNALINLVEMYYGGCIDKSEKNRLLSWLKSLRPQSTWKPSDEQIEALKEACNEHWESDGSDPLYTLYQYLKKLREEDV